MEISAYIKTKDTVQSFEASYKSVNGILYLFSFLGNIASIVFAYFFLYNILTGVTDNFFLKSVVTGLISILALTAFELLKRFLFKQTALTFIRSNNTGEKYAIGILSAMIISTSFYLSISGAHTLSDKSGVIITNTQQNIDLKFKSINADYQAKIDRLNKQIDSYTELMTNGTKSRVLRSQFNRSIEALNRQIVSLNNAKAKELETAKQDLKADGNTALDNSFSNVRAFLILSTFIELIILIGVGFDTYYNDRVFLEFDELVSNSRKHRTYVLYNRLLDAVYNNGKLSKSEFLLSTCVLSKVVKSIDLQVTETQVKNFYSLLGQLKVVELETRTKRKALLNFADAKKALKDYYRF